MDFRLKKCSRDRLGSLPNELICQILSSLPTKDAALASFSSRNMRKPGNLPPSLFACETLEVLKLDTNLDFELVSSMPSYRLPNLKVLQLRTILIPEDDFVTRLLSNCPLLEELYMNCWWKYGNSVTISSPSLKKLDLRLNRADEYSDFVSIDTPNLQYLKYTDLLAIHYSVASMNGLVEASFHDWDYLVTPRMSFDSMLSLLRAVSNVQHLSLMCSCVEVLDCDELKNQLPVFHNLTYLKLGYNRDGKWHTVLMEFLMRSPLLKTLRFPRGLIDEPNPCDDYSDIAESERQFFRTNQVIPSCCKSYLKRVFIKKCWGSEREVELVRFLLKTALVLEELLFVCEDKVDKPLLESTLKKLPRASSTCLIMVQ